jgi:hypothetical protein
MSLRASDLVSYSATVWTPDEQLTGVVQETVVESKVSIPYCFNQRPIAHRLLNNFFFSVHSF